MSRQSVRRRQAYLVDWLKHPTGLPDHPAVQPLGAMWTARELVERTGLYDSRQTCLADLHALRERGVVLCFGNRWRWRPTTWEGVQGT